MYYKYLYNITYHILYTIHIWVGINESDGFVPNKNGGWCSIYGTLHRGNDDKHWDLG